MKYSIRLTHPVGAQAKLTLHGLEFKVECDNEVKGKEVVQCAAATLKGPDGEAKLFFELAKAGWVSTEMEAFMGMSSEFFVDAQNTLNTCIELEKASAESSGDDSLLKKFSLSRMKSQAQRNCAVFLALTLEAYINEYGTDRLNEKLFEYFERLGPREKWIVIPKIATGKTFDPGSEPYQSVTRLFQVRDQWVHYKPRRIITKLKPKFSAKVEGRKIEAPDTKELEKLSGQVRKLVEELHKFDGTAPLTEF